MSIKDTALCAFCNARPCVCEKLNYEKHIISETDSIEYWGTNKTNDPSWQIAPNTARYPYTPVAPGELDPEYWAKMIHPYAIPTTNQKNSNSEKALREKQMKMLHLLKKAYELFVPEDFLEKASFDDIDRIESEQSPDNWALRVRELLLNEGVLDIESGKTIDVVK